MVTKVDNHCIASIVKVTSRMCIAVTVPRCYGASEPRLSGFMKIAPYIKTK